MNIENIIEWFKRAVPEPDDRAKCMQIGVHFEECSEMAEAAGHTINAEEISEYADYWKKHAEHEEAQDIDRDALLDALCDQIVTAIGVAHMFGMDISGALDEVNKSNWSKFVDGQPVFNASGKIAKGPDYKPPVLDSFLGQ